MTFEKANERCRQNYDAALASFHSQEEATFLTLLLGEDQYINQTSMWIGGQMLGFYSYEWEDETKWNFHNWAPYEPDTNTDNDKKCVEVLNEPAWAGKWANENCGQRKPFICRKDPSPSNPDSDAYLKSCDLFPHPDYTVQYRGSCYKFSMEAKSWQDAENSCKKVTFFLDRFPIEGSKLAHIFYTD